ncbi:hypothetical protein OUZ56_028408 [Daphnia magna]|uniref:Uncharacterized protein n=1 Tax=Daphnia magna TaxID=35525 RepID=A0ABR0B3S5_9CRUS|nr:hypothetical protein OUZ56_028408 [Daphnia magna]
MIIDVERVAHRGWADFHGELVILWVIRIKFSLPIARKLRFSTDGFILLSADWGGGEMMNSFFRTLEKFVKFVFDNGRLRRKRTGRRIIPKCGRPFNFADWPLKSTLISPTLVKRKADVLDHLFNVTQHQMGGDEGVGNENLARDFHAS